MFSVSFYFSKSGYCRLWQCPKMVWLKKYHPELAQEDPATEARMEAGNEIGDLAMGLFGDFVETTVLGEDGWPDINAMLDKTRECLRAGVENICEAAFSHDGLYCAVDILRKENGGYAIYEVKSSTGPKQVYAADIAYQKYVLENCGITVTGTYLICIDNQYVRKEALDIQKLFKVVDMTAMVAQEYPKVEGILQKGQKILDSDAEPVQDIGCHCADPYDCVFFGYCSRHLPSPSVLDLYVKRSGGLKLYQQGMTTFSDVLKKGKPNKKQQRQIHHALDDCGEEIDKAGIQAYLDTLTYPLHFLDFESMQQAIPQYPGARPYAQIPFQYSLHYIDTPGGELKHKEFLAEPDTDPRRAIAESLWENIPVNACVMVYNKTFECTRLQELAELYPDLSAHLLTIRENISDLMIPFNKGYYYTRSMGCSVSIKSVLPALFPDDPELDYHNLEGVHNGGEAMNLYPQLGKLPPEAAAQLRKDLLAYCKLDTYAMVKIWQKLREAVQ